MRHQSYLRTVVAGTGQVIPALRPPRKPVWGLRRPVTDFSGLRPSPPADRGSAPGLSLRNRTQLADATQLQVKLQNDEPKSAPDNVRSIPAPGAPEMLNKRTAATAVETVIASVASWVSSEEAAPLEPPSPHRSWNARDATNTTGQVGHERAERQENTGDRDKALRGVVPPSRTVGSKSAHAPLQATISGRKAAVDTPPRAHPEVAVLQQATPVPHDTTRNPAATRQADEKRSGNAVHIGSVDIHIQPAPAPVPRHRVRHPTPPGPITRGFAPFFGLSQG